MLTCSSKAKSLRRDNPEKNADLYAEHEKQDWSVRGVLHRTLYRPFQMLLMEPILVLVTIYLSIVYGVLYARKSIFIQIRSNIYHIFLQYLKQFPSSLSRHGASRSGKTASSSLVLVLVPHWVPSSITFVLVTTLSSFLGGRASHHPKNVCMVR